MTTATSIRLVMNMLVRISAADRRGIHFRGVELKDPRLLVIERDNAQPRRVLPVKKPRLKPGTVY
jgi:hypothetical protein